MRIIHTSDWHLGHILYGNDRGEEFKSMLDQMAAIVAEQRPDAFVVSGDIFHTSSPSNYVQSLLAEGLMRIRQASPGTTVVVTAGNHDSGSRLDIFRIPWRALGVHVVGQFYRDEPESHIIELPGIGFIIAVPYINDFFFPEGLYVSLQQAVAERNADGLPVVMMAHTTVAGSDISWHGNGGDYSAGGINSQSVELFGQDFDYLALGHIHKAQRLGERVCYCGTPLPVSFDERGDHGVLLVDIEAHGRTPVVTPIPIVDARPLVTLPESGAADWETARGLLERFPADRECYLRLNVTVDGSGFLPPMAAVEASRIAETKRCRFCYINPVHEDDAPTETAAAMNVEEFRQERPVDIVARYLKDKNIPFDDELRQVFDDVLRDLEITD